MGIDGVAKGEAKIPQMQVIEPQKVLFTADKQKELEEWALELQLPILKSIADDLNIKIKIVPIYVGVIDDALLLRVDRAIRSLF
jgi:AmmeMemoRadiSam system protein B